MKYRILVHTGVLANGNLYELQYLGKQPNWSTQAASFFKYDIKHICQEGLDTEEKLEAYNHPDTWITVKH